jgi:serine/threonine protein kinase
MREVGYTGPVGVDRLRLVRLGVAVEAGQELAGRYRLDRRLGRGGMGEVWSATDLFLDRPVAVKLMLADMLDKEAGDAIARFRRESKAAARLNHPNIAVIYDAGMHEAHSYLVMELLRGPDLRTLLQGTPGGMPVDVALEHGAQAAEAFAAAHDAGVVHRDVKPANLLLDKVNRLKVCDFGVAALAGATQITRPGTVVGTVAYMAPEQLLGQPAAGAMDVYALGATLYHLITGRPPFPDVDRRTVGGFKESSQQCR